MSVSIDQAMTSSIRDNRSKNGSRSTPNLDDTTITWLEILFFLSICSNDEYYGNSIKTLVFKILG